MDLEYKTVILTGASSGIGAEILKLLEKTEGTRVIAVARNTDNITERKGRIIPYSADLTKKEEIDKLFSYAEESFGRIDVFIANAGFGYLEEISEPDWNRIDNIFKLNVFSPIYSLEKMAAQQTGNNDKICFVVTSSVAGLKALPGYSLYSASKFAVSGFTDAYRYEKSENIRITTVYPVAVKTDFFDKASGEDNTPMPWPRQKPKTVAKALIRGLEREKSKVYPSVLYRMAKPFSFIVNYFMSREKKRFDKWRSARKTETEDEENLPQSENIQ